MMMTISLFDDDDDNKPVWPTWDVGDDNDDDKPVIEWVF
jgi:hypothetical protein